MKTTTLILLLFSSSITLAQFTAIPDQNFEQALIDLGLDDVIDGQVLTANISGVEELDIPNLNIQDLTGIEDFQSLLELWVDSNDLTTINLSQNVLLEFLSVGFNPLTTIDITNNLNLWALSASYTNISVLNTSMNVFLEILDVEGCQLNQLDLTNNLELGFLSAGENSLTEIDLSNNTLLDEVYLGENQLTSIDVSHLQNLIALDVYFNPFEELDLSNNQLLETLYCEFSPNLNFINIKNGNNSILEEFDAFNIAQNACIQVDDAAAATAGTAFPYNLWEVDASAIFSEDCSLSTPGFAQFELTAYPNPTRDKLYIKTNETLSYSIFSIEGKVIERVQPLLENQIPLSQLNSGVYLVHFQNAAHQFKTIKISKK